MISILFLLHVTLLLWALSGSRLILCLKPIGITRSPEQNDSLQVWSVLAVVRCYSLVRDTWELWCLGAAAQPRGGGSWKVPTTHTRWSGMGQGFVGSSFIGIGWPQSCARGRGHAAGLHHPAMLRSQPLALREARKQSHREELALQLLGQPTCCWSDLHSVQSCIKRRIFFPCRNINSCWFFTHNLESLLLKMWLVAH